MTNSAEAFRINIKSILKHKGWSQSDLARSTNMATSLITRYLTGDSNPGLEIIDRFAKALAVSPAQLIEEKSHPGLKVLGPSRQRLLALMERLSDSDIEHMLTCWESISKAFGKEEKRGA